MLRLNMQRRNSTIHTKESPRNRHFIPLTTPIMVKSHARHRRQLRPRPRDVRPTLHKIQVLWKYTTSTQPIMVPITRRQRRITWDAEHSAREEILKIGRIVEAMDLQPG
jgi:hypothetical protein